MKLALSILVLALFSSPLFAQDRAAMLAAAGCGPLSIEFDVKTDKTKHTEGQLEDGKALVYFFEDEKTDPGFKLSSATTRVGLDGQWVGANHGESYFFFAVDPGPHNLCTSWQSSLGMYSKLVAATSLKAQAGRVYYFRARVDERTHQRPSIAIAPIDPAEAKLLIASSPLSDSHPKQK